MLSAVLVQESLRWYGRARGPHLRYLAHVHRIVSIQLLQGRALLLRSSLIGLSLEGWKETNTSAFAARMLQLQALKLVDSCAATRLDTAA
jgi:hypothetical protein